MVKQVMQVLVIHNNELTGALNQSLGVARAINSHANITVIAIRVRQKKLHQLIRILNEKGLFRFIGPNGWFAPLWRLLYTTNKQISDKPDLIISHLGSTENSSVSLSKFWGIPTIYIGMPRYYPVSAFSMVISGYDLGGGMIANNVLSLETVPSHILPEEAEKLGARLRNEIGLTSQEELWCFVAGGNCAGYGYSLEDWDALADFMTACAEELGVRWLITTSRRTGIEGEVRLRGRVGDATWLLFASWYHTGKQKGLASLVGAASHCVVTEESLSMISDCVSLGRQVYTWGPVDRSVPIEVLPNVTRIRGFLKKLEEKKRIIRLPELSTDLAGMQCLPVPENEHWVRLVEQKARELEII